MPKPIVEPPPTAMAQIGVQLSCQCASFLGQLERHVHDRAVEHSGGSRAQARSDGFTGLFLLRAAQNECSLRTQLKYFALEVLQTAWPKTTRPARA